MNSKLLLCAAVLICTILLAEGAPQHNVNNNCRRQDCHTSYNGCECQCGGERGGHCHCAYGREFGQCRDGGNHSICFPFNGEQDCVNRGIERPDNPMMG